MNVKNSNLTVMLSQIHVEFGNPKRNLEVIIAHIKDKTITNEHCLFIFPELCLSGYAKSAIEESAFTGKNGKYLDPLLELTKRSNLSIFCSLAEEERGTYYNTAVYLQAGQINAKYRKSHLFAPMGETELFEAGRELVSFKLFETLVGAAICYDLRFPELFNELAKSGVELFLIVAEWPKSRINHWKQLIIARAIEQQSYVIAVNRVGADPDYIYGGHSLIVDPFGEVLEELSEKEEVKEVSISFEKIQQFKEIFDVQKDKWL